MKVLLTPKMAALRALAGGKRGQWVPSVMLSSLSRPPADNHTLCAALAGGVGHLSHKFVWLV